MRVGSVLGLTRYPVKSVGGESLQQVEVTPRGLVGDRVWAVYTDDGFIGSGKSSYRFRHVEGLLTVRARLSGERPVVELPDGTTGLAGDPDTDRRLSGLLGRPLTVRPETTVSHHDASPLHLVTTASLRRLEQRLGEPVDVRRLRPNLVLDVPGADFVEDGWRGRELAVGEHVVLALGPAMERCAMVNAAQRGLAHESRLLKLISREHDLELGLQVSVVRPGPLALGDPAHLT